MDQVIAKTLETARGIGTDHGPMVLLVFTMLILFALVAGGLVYFIGGRAVRSIDNVATSVTVMSGVVDDVAQNCMATGRAYPPQPRYQGYPQFPPAPPAAPVHPQALPNR